MIQNKSQPIQLIWRADGLLAAQEISTNTGHPEGDTKGDAVNGGNRNQHSDVIISRQTGTEKLEQGNRIPLDYPP